MLLAIAYKQRWFTPSLMSRFALIAGLLVISCPVALRAQYGTDDVSLGDVARIARESKSARDQAVIDNDNLSVMMDKAEAERLNGKPVFSIDPSGKTFRMTSPDGTCSLSFDANATALISTPYIASELPQYELLNLNGSAAIHDGALEITVHNGTGWDVKEIVVAITVLQSQVSPELMPAKLLAGNLEPAEKLPDTAVLYHLKASAAPDSTTIFRGNLGDGLADIQNWHWALISARGVPPAAPGSLMKKLSGAGSQTPSSHESSALPSPANSSVSSDPPASTPQPLPAVSPTSPSNSSPTSAQR